MNRATLLISLISLVACGGPDWDYFSHEFDTVLPFDILSVFDQHLYENEIGLTPRVHSEDGFYLVESPEQLDSVFYDIHYWYSFTPRLDTLFPEDGMLVLFDYFYPCGTQLLEYRLEGIDDTLRVSIDLRKDLEYFDTKCTSCLFAIGVIDQPDI